MKKYIFLLVTLVFVSSCSYKVDRTDIFKVAEAINESFARQDSLIIKEIYEFRMDSLTNEQRDKIKKISEFFDRQTQPIKVDTVSYLNGLFRSVQLFYEKGGHFYCLRAYYDQDTVNDKYFINWLSFLNINEECESYKQKPYIPNSEVDFKEISWTTDYYGKTFKSGFVELENNTGGDITYIKFKVILKNYTVNKGFETFLNQTIESYKPIYKGDIARIDVPGIIDYYTGFRITSDNLLFDAKLLEVKPKPESYWCNMIDSLRELTEGNNVKSN